MTRRQQNAKNLMTRAEKSVLNRVQKNLRASSNSKKPRHNFSLFNPQKPWQIYFSLLLALVLPFFAELFQIIFIGDERVCCMPDNLEFLSARAEIAKFLHPLSNFLIGGSMVAGIFLAVKSGLVAKRRLAPKIPQKSRQKIFLITVVIFTTYVVLLLVAMLTFFVFRNGWYWYGRPWPGGGLFDGPWYNPNHWRTIIFH